MKTFALASTAMLTAAALASPSWAQTPSRERGTVISVTPIVEQVLVARRVCDDEPVTVRRQPSGAGALFGAIAGGAVGNAIGAGSGRAAATALGVFSGAVIGNNIESGGQPTHVQTARRCTTEDAYEDRTRAYSVVYEYGGREYTTQMRRDPGRYVNVQVQAAPEGEVEERAVRPRTYRSGPPAASSRPPPVYVERPGYRDYPEPVYETYPAPGPAYYEPGYPQFGTGLVLGALIGYGIHHGYSHRHGWRRGR